MAGLLDCCIRRAFWKFTQHSIPGGMIVRKPKEGSQGSYSDIDGGNREYQGETC